MNMIIMNLVLKIGIKRSIELPKVIQVVSSKTRF